MASGSSPRIRFSADAERPTSDVAGHPHAPRRQSGLGLRIDTIGAVEERSAATDGAAHEEEEKGEFPSEFGDAPSSEPRRRNRGYSLRRNLFFRNQQSYQDERPTSSRTPSHESEIPLSATERLELRDLGHPADPPPEYVKPEVDHGDEPPLYHRRSAAFSSTWVQRQTRKLQGVVKPPYERVRKFVLRIQDIPASKDGRQIPVAAEVELLIDERTNRTYIDNTITSCRYTLWNFLPKQLFAQFSKLANFYFLCVSILQLIPKLSTTGTYTTIVPLMFFVTLSMSKEGYDDYRRYKLDRVENNRESEILDRTNGQWKPKKWRDIRVGDVIKLDRDDAVPADILLLSSKGPNGIAYVETMALDGETNLKSKVSVPSISKHCDTLERLSAFKADVVIEDPNLDLYNFDGKVTLDGETVPLTNNQVIYRGSVLRNTSSMIGLVLFTGEESKIRMNANKDPRTKAPNLQTLVNRIVIFVVVFVILLALFCTVAYQIWRPQTESKSWYLTDSSVAFFPIFAGYIIAFNTLIPLSLYVSLEIIKLGQMFLFDDIDMYHEESDTPFEARTSTINEDCGQISYIFSDKTGTLTDNFMLFRKLSVAGQAWLHDLDIQREADKNAGRVVLRHKRRKGKGKSKKALKRSSTVVGDNPAEPRKSQGDAVAKNTGEASKRSKAKMSLDGLLGRPSFSSRPSFSGSARWTSSAHPNRAQPQLCTQELLGYLQEYPHTQFARKARFFLLAVALCHTCLPETAEDGDITYQAASPDELALVQAAKELGYIVVDRQVNTVTIRTFPNGVPAAPMEEVYEVLDVIEFSSKRKRMSIVIRMPNGSICIFSKGADSAILDLLRLKDLAKKKVAEVERRASIRRSIEAQEVMRRNSLHRNSIGGRTSIGGGRPSFGGPSRPSMTANRLQPIADDFDGWREKAEDDESSIDSDSLYSRPSGQFGARHSIALGDVPNSPLERDRADDLIDEALVLDDARVFERCFAHINDFASEGLRTLLYGHRFISEDEYKTWKAIYAEATTSLVGRQEKIETAAELIEQKLELTGATAIEDKLQQGVPEAIDKLRRAGIKLWMLTGDKRETAINIGHSCRLIKDYSTVTVLDQDDPELAKTIKAAIAEIEDGAIAHSVVVVDGGTLSYINADPILKPLFFDVAIATNSVICCRASPSQKASLVKTVRTKVTNSVTLAIGDGANDVSMIQEAHVGIGIAGKEGLQAARVSDYSMAQFRFLLKFLLVHGRYNYVRTCKYTLATFWKEMFFYLTQALFQLWNGYTGTSFYESWSLSMFNTLFTSLPVIFLGIFEKDLSASTLLAYPELYTLGILNRSFNFRTYLTWMFLASTQAMLAYFLIYSLYAPSITVPNDLYPIGTLCYSICITVIAIKLQILELHNKNIMAFIAVFLSIGGWWMWCCALASTYKNNTKYWVLQSLFERYGKEGSWWLVYLFAVAVCVLLDIVVKAIKRTFWPSENEVFQEIEKDPVARQAMEERAAGELQNGWGVAKVQKPVEMEEGRDSGTLMEEGRGGRPSFVERVVGRRSADLIRRRSSVVGREEAEKVFARRFGSIRA